MGYADYFNFEREPFSNAPNERFYFDSEQHRRALQRLKYSVDTDKGLAVLVGGIGTGKTTLARRMLDNLPFERYESSLLVIIHSDITPQWLLSRICVQLGVENPDPSPLIMLKQLFERLVQIEEEGRKSVVLIDEAQMLQTRELMEEFRGLLNLEVPEKKLLNIIFFGLPDLDDVLMLDKPLAQRVAFKYTLTPFAPLETAAYIAFRLKVSGSDQSPFLPETLPLIQSYSGGVPRLINTICDNALFETYLRHGREVTEGIITSVVQDLGLKMQGPVDAEQFLDQSPDHEDLEIVFDELEVK